MGSPLVEVKAVGNLGNQMLQLMLMQALQQRWPALQFGGIDLPDWNISRKLETPIRQPALRLIGQHVDLALTRDLMERGIIRELEFAALGFRMSHYLSKSAQEALFPRRHIELPGDIRNCVLINVRGAEILADTHADYGPIPIAFYRQLVQQIGLPPIFMGQMGSDPYSASLRAAFPDAPVWESRGAMSDFELIRSARHVVVSVSTFSWLAAWLSDAQTVHMPVFGMFNPAQRPDIDLLPVADPRYRFYRFPMRQWTGAPQQFADLTKAADFPVMTPADLMQLTSAAAAQLEPAARGYRRRLIWRALMHRYAGRGGRVGLTT